MESFKPNSNIDPLSFANYIMQTSNPFLHPQIGLNFSLPYFLPMAMGYPIAGLHAKSQPNSFTNNHSSSIIQKASNNDFHEMINRIKGYSKPKQVIEIPDEKLPVEKICLEVKEEEIEDSNAQTLPNTNSQSQIEKSKVMKCEIKEKTILKLSGSGGIQKEFG